MTERAPAREAEYEEADDAPEPLLEATHARIDALEHAIAERDAAIAARRATLASPAITGSSPMERHAARVRELEATLASARSDRDTAKAALPQGAQFPVAPAMLLLVALFALWWLMLGAR